MECWPTRPIATRTIKRRFWSKAITIGNRGFIESARGLPSVGGAQEVVAESWPSENLVEACIDCVDSWRHSPGHWEAVRSRHPLFGFDIQRGRNGIWYATGIFGHR